MTPLMVPQEKEAGQSGHLGPVTLSTYEKMNGTLLPRMMLCSTNYI